MGGGRQQTQTVQQDASPWAGQQPYMLDLWRRAQQAQGQTNNQMFEGDLYAGPTNPQQTANSAQINLAQQAAGTLGQGTDQGIQALLRQLQGANAQTTQGSPEGLGNSLQAFTGPSNLQQQIAANTQPLVDQWREQIMPQMQQEFVGTGTYDNTRAGFEVANAFENAVARPGHQIAAQATQDEFMARMGLGAQSYENNLNRTLQDIMQQRGIAQSSAGMLPGMEQAWLQSQLAPIDMMRMAGGEQQGWNQGFLDEAMQLYQLQQMAPWAGLDMYSNIVQGNPFMSQTTTSTGPRQGGGLGGAIQGGLGSGMGAMALGLSGPVGWGVAGLGALAGLLG